MTWPTFPTAVDCLAGTTPSTIPGFCQTNGQYLQDIAHYNEMMGVFGKMSVTPGSVICLGDSLTETLQVTRTSPFAVNIGVSGDTLRGLLNRLSNTPGIHQAGAVILMGMPINDTGIELQWPANATQAQRDQWMLEDVNLFLQYVAAWLTGPLVVWNLLPIDKTRYSTPVSIAQIATINGYFATIFGSRSNTVLLDARDGGFDATTDTWDGIHPNSAGQAIIHAMNRTALTALGVQ